MVAVFLAGDMIVVYSELNLFVLCLEIAEVFLVVDTLTVSLATIYTMLGDGKISGLVETGLMMVDWHMVVEEVDFLDIY